MRRRGVLETTMTMTDEDDRRQSAKQYWSPYATCKRVSNKSQSASFCYSSTVDTWGLC